MTSDPLSPEGLAEMRRDLAHYAPDGLAVVHPKTLLALIAAVEHLRAVTPMADAEIWRKAYADALDETERLRALHDSACQQLNDANCALFAANKELDRLRADALTPAEAYAILDEDGIQSVASAWSSAVVKLARIAAHPTEGQ